MTSWLTDWITVLRVRTDCVTAHPFQGRERRCSSAVKLMSARGDNVPLVGV